MVKNESVLVDYENFDLEVNEVLYPPPPVCREFFTVCNFSTTGSLQSLHGDRGPDPGRFVLTVLSQFFVFNSGI